MQTIEGRVLTIIKCFDADFFQEQLSLYFFWLTISVAFFSIPFCNASDWFSILIMFHRINIHIDFILSSSSVISVDVLYEDSKL